MACFCIAHDPRIKFPFLNDWKNSKEGFVTHENYYMKFKEQYQEIKFIDAWPHSLAHILVVAASYHNSKMNNYHESVWPRKPKIFTCWHLSPAIENLSHVKADWYLLLSIPHHYTSATGTICVVLTLSACPPTRHSTLLFALPQMLCPCSLLAGFFFLRTQWKCYFFRRLSLDSLPRPPSMLYQTTIICSHLCMAYTNAKTFK
jgi:hypothetical protein